MSQAISSKDHLGQEFPSLTAMCRHWHLKFFTVWYRLEAGWSIEETLTTPPLPHNRRNRTRCRDHLGREFISQVEMCRAWGINIHTFRGRRFNGLSVKEALTKPVQKEHSRRKIG